MLLSRSFSCYRYFGFNYLIIFIVVVDVIADVRFIAAFQGEIDFRVIFDIAVINQVRFCSLADFPDLSASRNQKSHLIRPSYNLKIIKITIFTQKLRLLRIFHDEIN